MATLNIRNVPEDVARRFKAGAALSGLPLAEYLAVLLSIAERSKKGGKE